MPTARITLDWIRRDGGIPCMPTARITLDWIRRDGGIPCMPTARITLDWIRRDGGIPCMPTARITLDWIRRDGGIPCMPTARITLDWIRRDGGIPCWASSRACERGEKPRGAGESCLSPSRVHASVAPNASRRTPHAERFTPNASRRTLHAERSFIHETPADTPSPRSSRSAPQPAPRRPAVTHSASSPHGYCAPRQRQVAREEGVAGQHSAPMPDCSR